MFWRKKEEKNNNEEKTNVRMSSTMVCDTMVSHSSSTPREWAKETHIHGGEAFEPTVCILLIEDVAANVLSNLPASDLSRVSCCCKLLLNPLSFGGKLSVVEMSARLRVERLVHHLAELDMAEGLCVSCEEKGGTRYAGDSGGVNIVSVLLQSFHELHVLARECGGEAQTLTRTNTYSWVMLLRLIEGYTRPIKICACAAALGQTGHSLMLDHDGSIWSFGGEGLDGRLGLGDRHARLLPHRISTLHLPPIASIACGGAARCASVTGGEGGWLTDRNLRSEALLNSGTEVGFTPRGTGLAVRHAGFSVAVSREGRVFVWGDSAHGCLGLGHVHPSFVPRQVPALSGYVVRQVAAGGAHCVAVTQCGLVFAWGSGRFGQLGVGSRSRHLRPVEVTGLRCEGIVSVAAAAGFSGFVSQRGDLWMCGCSWDGQLGSGSRGYCLYPSLVTHFSDPDDLQHQHPARAHDAIVHEEEEEEELSDALSEGGGCHDLPGPPPPSLR